MSTSIVYWNRSKACEEVEQVYGEAVVAWLYGTRSGQGLSDWLMSSRLPSQAYGMYQSSLLSRGKIRPFIHQFCIPMEEYEDPGFRSFNDFFIRKFKPGMREFAADPNRMPAFAEARYFAWDKITEDQTFPVKGRFMTPAALLGDAELAREFFNGPLLLARLCPVDYHRFHYPDGGRTLKHYRVAGKLHSVNPLALKYKGEILSTNERYVSILETRNFGKLAYIEVGAMMVGRIVQTHPWDKPFERGDEKGYFLFGGSTVIVLGQEGAWRPDTDLLEQTTRHHETYVKLGDAIAKRGT
jgi:phosphatidylserine decarboxylase